MRLPRVSRDRLTVHGTQLLLLVGFLTAWEYVPQVSGLQEKVKFLDPFFISAPSRIMTRLAELMTGGNGSVLIWPYVWPTLSASLIGLVIGVVLGALFGLLLSSSRFLSRVGRPFVVALNAIPRIALIPIIVIILGPTYLAAIVISVIVVFFVAFFNAYEGGRTVALHLLQNATVMGADRWAIMWNIRAPYVLAWTLAAAPLAATFSLLVVVTGELLTGSVGMGRILFIASTSADATLTFAVVVLLSVLGVSVVSAIGYAQRRAMHWWTES